MCGRYTLTVSLEDLMLYYELSTIILPAYEPRYNIAPTQQIPAVIHDGQANRLGLLQWGFIPNWAKNKQMAHQMINARAESITEKPAFKTSFVRKRCIIPADGFYEWKTTSTGKQPMRFIPKNHHLFNMAAIYDTWISPDNEKISSCSIITTEANDVVAPVHHRMPVLLDKQATATWLDRSIQQPELLLPLLQPYAADQMEVYAVTPEVGNARLDSVHFIERYKTVEQLRF
ncbi:SOS response-associated peptidase [Paenibacillus yanchengensis]|uniref:Abasic site processing protein n=1 Tax=Paenibacillus yanchengensis TaxID=2035833 RepID=A0ABW4YN57_9BACL